MSAKVLDMVSEYEEDMPEHGMAVLKCVGDF